MLTKRTVLLGIAAGCFGLNAVSAVADSYPSRPIKVILPFPPGTSSELIVRVIADQLSSRFGQPLIIENRPGGAGGTVGAAAVATAKPDGYTLLASTPGPLVTAAAIYKKLGYDPGKSFAPILLLYSTPQLLAVNPAVPANSVQELVAYAKNNPGKVSFASPGYGTQPHLLGEMLKATGGIDIVHVPYKGPAAAITDLVAGQVQMYFENAALIVPHAEAGKLKVLAVAGESRIARLPHVPTAAESGFPKLLGRFWSGLLAPAGTPDGIVKQLNSAINEIMQSAQVQAHLKKLNSEATPGSPQDFAAFIASETQKWSAAAKAAGVHVN